MNVIKGVVVLMSVFLLTACGNGDFQVTAKFENTQDIKEGTTVYHDGKEIGSVSHVSISDTGSTIELNLNSKPAKKLAAKSAILVNRLRKGDPLEIYNRVAINPEKLKSGQEIEGLDSIFQLGAWMVGDVIKIGTQGLTEYVGDFQEFIDSDEFKQSKQQVQEQMLQAAQSATDAVKMVEKDVIATLNDLSLSEEQMAQTIEQLSKELAPIVGEVAQSSSEMVSQLEQLIVSVESSSSLKELKAGEKLLQSLATTFENLNESVVEGVEKGLNSGKD